MKYRYEFEMNEDFEKGCCYTCPMSYVDWNNFSDFDDVYCVLHKKYDECPLVKVEE